MSEQATKIVGTSVFDKLTSMNDSSAVFAISVLNLIIILIVIILYLYYTGTIFSKR